MVQTVLCLFTDTSRSIACFFSNSKGMKEYRKRGDMKKKNIILSKTKKRLVAYYPEERKPIAQILILPGGAYCFTSSREGRPVAKEFVQRGYACYVLDYSCMDESAYPQPLLEVCQAISFIKDETTEKRIPTFLMGFSAGGHLAALYGSSFLENSLYGHVEEDQRKRSVQAMVLNYPVVDLQSFLDQHDDEHFGAMFQGYDKRKDPLALLNNKIPPTFIFATREDPLIGAKDTMEYAQKLVEAGVITEFHLFSRGNHALATADEATCSDRYYPRRVHLWIELAHQFLLDEGNIN